MAIATLLIISGYFLIRTAIRFSDFERTHSEYKTRIWKACLACGSFALESPLYLLELLTYNSSPFSSPPLTPVWLFLGWLVVVVVDALYQFRMMDRIRLEPEARIELEESGVLGKKVSQISN